MQIRHVTWLIFHFLIHYYKFCTPSWIKFPLKSTNMCFSEHCESQCGDAVCVYVCVKPLLVSGREAYEPARLSVSLL